MAANVRVHSSVQTVNKMMLARLSRLDRPETEATFRSAQRHRLATTRQEMGCMASEHLLPV